SSGSKGRASITRTCLPLVRYTLKIPTPPADMPKLKNRACAENRGESGNSRSANGSSKDSSTSRCVKELSGPRGELFQSNSIKSRFVTHSPMQCPYIVFTHAGDYLSNGFLPTLPKKWATGSKPVAHLHLTPKRR